ncbi:MAG: Xaa-Pro peptidase family protein [Gemmatimonadales bacterium]
MAPDLRGSRQQALLQALEAEGLTALVVQHPPNIRYLCGFTGSAGLLVIRHGGAVLVTDFRYAEQAPDEVGASAQVDIEPVNLWDRVRKVLASADTVGFEAHVATVREAGRMGEGRRLTPTEGLVERLRVRKSPVEVEAIRAAASLAQDALAEVLPGVHPGETELAVAARLESALRVRGSEWHPFPTIVASGPRAALPHARSTGRTLGAGELLLIDFGAQLDGYCSDLTRTVVLGKADGRQREVYAVVEAAQRRALEGVRAGMTGREADALAREVIGQRGYGEAFGHSLGHGLGLEVHEAPRLSPTAEGVLPVGAVVTIEPGIYLPGWGGVRLEDDVWLAPDGPHCLSDGRTALIEV